MSSDTKIMRLRWLLRGLAQFRFPELVRDLIQRRVHLETIAEIRRRNPGVIIENDVRLVNYKPEYLVIASQSRLSQGNVLAFGDPLNGFGRITIGEHTWVGDYNNIRAGGGDVEIGSNCLISQFCTLVASNHGMSREQLITFQPPPKNNRGIVIGNDVWIGAGSTVTPGRRVGDGVVIGAGSVVTKDIADYEIWAGIPAQKIGERR